jgi:ABC-type dipeptide/oligopeptide/nickel transport system ATPase component
MSAVNTTTVVTTKQAGALIASLPKVRFHLMGEPGVGKSSVLTYVTDQLPTHNGVYVDMSTVFEGDTLMPAMDHENKVAR